MRLAGMVALLLMFGCGLIQKHVYTSARPSDGAEIRVEEVCGFPDCTVSVVLGRWPARQVLTYRGGCGVVIFAHVAWSGNVAAVFADVAYAEPIKFAYDVAGQHEVDFSSAEPWLKKAIIETTESRRRNCGRTTATYSSGLPGPIIAARGPLTSLLKDTPSSQASSGPV